MKRKSPRRRGERRTIFRRQPASAMFSNYALMRKMMDWYYMRIIIYVLPRAIYWWEAGDFSRPAQILEVAHVG